MAKDPAFLFYYRDFLVGTSFMTLEEMGAYIKLLCFQADRGHLTEAQILKKIPAPIWDAICGHFRKDEKGFYNERLSLEIEKRRLFTESRRKNLHKKQHMEPHMEPHMGIHMENANANANEDINDNEKHKGVGFRPPAIKQVQAYCQGRSNGIDPAAFIDFYASKGWMIGKNKMKDWRAAIRTWENSRKEEFKAKPTQAQINSIASLKQFNERMKNEPASL